MQTTIAYCSYIGIMEKTMETNICLGYAGIMEKRTETSITVPPPAWARHGNSQISRRGGSGGGVQLVGR